MEESKKCSNCGKVVQGSYVDLSDEKTDESYVFCDDDCFFEFMKDM